MFALAYSEFTILIIAMGKGTGGRKLRNGYLRSTGSNLQTRHALLGNVSQLSCVK